MIVDPSSASLCTTFPNILTQVRKWEVEKTGSRRVVRNISMTLYHTFSYSHILSLSTTPLTLSLSLPKEGEKVRK